jgi:hypothetical protein
MRWTGGQAKIKKSGLGFRGKKRYNGDLINFSWTNPRIFWSWPVWAGLNIVLRWGLLLK